MQVAALKQNNVCIKIANEYFNLANIFSKKKVLVLPEQTELNEHVIRLENGKQLPYGPIYSLKLVK